MKRDKNIKITPITHELLKKYCEEHGLKMFQFVESLIKKNCIIPKTFKDIYNED
jgi:hypothetical protein